MKKMNITVLVAIENKQLFSLTINLKYQVAKVLDSDQNTWQEFIKAVKKSEIPASDKEDFIKWLDESEVNDLYDYFSISLPPKSYPLDNDNFSGFLIPVIFDTNMMYVKYLQELHEREVES